VDGAKPVVILQTTVPLTLKAFFSGQLQWFRENGFDVHIVSSPHESLFELAEAEGVTAHPVPMRRAISPVPDLVSLVRLWQLYRKIRPDIVHGFTLKAGLLAMIAARLAGVPVPLYSILGTPEEGRGPVSFAIFLVERCICFLAQAVYCECKSIKDVIVKHRLKAPEKTKVVAAWSWNTIGPFLEGYQHRESMRQQMRARLGIPQESLVIGYVGRIVVDKGIRELYAAFRELAADFPDLVLLLVGDFEPEHPMENELRAALLSEPRVRITGFRNDVPSYMAGMDVLVHPSYREGLPTVPLEAGAIGLPVITTRIPGCVDAVTDGVTGMLIESHHAAQLRDAIRVLLEDGEARERMGRAGHDWVAAQPAPSAQWRALLEQYRLQLQAMGCLHTGRE
jgi:glycosyltransferase involved in cell wall biosynthesis